jgi:transposase InsO family protein
MNIHKNARLTLHGRAHLVAQVTSLGASEAADAAGVSTRTAYKWRWRFNQGGVAALHDRSSRPDHSPNSLGGRVARWVRRLRRWCHWTMRQIAWALHVSLTSVWRLCAAFGLSRLRPPAEPTCRYEHEQAGDLLHMDTKKMVCIGGRGSGYQVMHVAIDDHSRVAFVQILPDETKYSAIAFLKATVDYFERQRVHIKRLLTDNGSAYWSRDFADACREFEIAHTFTRPHRPQTNGKAERFIQTCLREWVYARHYATNLERTKALKPWLKFYNNQRPHSALDYQPPASRLPNNVLKHNT